MKKVLITFLLFSFALQSCKQKDIKRESVLDNISHTEDSIYYKIDSIPMLCDELGMKSQFIDIGDCKLYCEIKGQGVPLVVINGGPGGTHHCFHPWFAKAEKFAKVIYYDQRGCGQSDYVRGDGYTFKQAVDDLDKLRQKIGVEKWVICGYSYGGALAQYYMATYPEHVMGTVLIGSATLLQSDALNGSRQNMFISEAEDQKIDECYELYGSGKLNLFQLLYNKKLNGDWKRQNFYKPTKEEAIRVALYEWKHDEGFNPDVSRSRTRYDFKNVFDNNPIPTLICEGKWDLTWLPEKADIFKQNHPNAQFVLFENAGHTIFSEDPKLFFSTLKTFINSLNPITETEIVKWKTHAASIIKPQEELFVCENEFMNIINNESIDKALRYYTEFKAKNDKQILFAQSTMNRLGYKYLKSDNYDTAINIFKMNVDAYPDSWNAYNSLGEAYLKAGNEKLAHENLKKSLELNPENESAKKILAQ